MKKQSDRHAAETAVLVRMTGAQRKELEEAVKILNDRANPQGGRFYVGPFMLQAALRMAKEVAASHTTHVTGKRSP